MSIVIEVAIFDIVHFASSKSHNGMLRGSYPDMIHQFDDSLLWSVVIAAAKRISAD
jgi:hypothetical protein